MTALHGQKQVPRCVEKLTLGHIPAQVSESVPRVVGKRCRENSLSRILYYVRHASDKLDDVGRCESFRCNKVADEVAIHY